MISLRSFQAYALYPSQNSLKYQVSVIIHAISAQLPNSIQSSRNPQIMGFDYSLKVARSSVYVFQAAGNKLLMERSGD